MSVLKFIPLIIALAEAIKPIIDEIEAMKTEMKSTDDVQAKVDKILQDLDGAVQAVVKALA